MKSSVKRFIVLALMALSLMIVVSKAHSQVIPQTAFRVMSGTALPSTCGRGQIFYVSTNTSLYLCTATNTWSAIGVGGNFLWNPTLEFLGIGSSATQLAAGNFLTVSESVNSSVQGNIQNTSNGVNASGDWVVTTDVGNNGAGYGDFGCNGSGYSQVAYNSGTAGDCYLIVQGTGSSNGNLQEGTGTIGTQIKWNVGGFTALQTLMQLNLANGLMLQNPTPMVSPALTLTQAIAQTSLTFTAPSTLTTISGTAPSMTVNGTFSGGGSNAYLNWAFTIAGATNAGNNGTWICTGSSTSALTFTIAGGVAETLPSGATVTSAVGTSFVGTITGGAANAYASPYMALTTAGFTNGGNNVASQVPIASSATAIATTSTTAVNETHAGTIISSAVVSSPPLQLCGTYGNANTPAADCWTIQNIINSTASLPSDTLNISRSGSSGGGSVTIAGNTSITGFVSPRFVISTGTMGLATGAAAGSGPSIACTTNHVCAGFNGTVTLTTGTSPTTGTLATLTFPNSHTNQADCDVSMQSATGLITTNTWSTSTTVLTITANTSLTASTAYTLTYICGGN